MISDLSNSEVYPAGSGCGGKCNLVCNVHIGVSIYIISLWEAIYLLSHMLFVSAYVGF